MSSPWLWVLRAGLARFFCCLTARTIGLGVSLIDDVPASKVEVVGQPFLSACSAQQASGCKTLANKPARLKRSFEQQRSIPDVQTSCVASTNKFRAPETSKT